jgi:hypothetical protein
MRRIFDESRRLAFEVRVVVGRVALGGWDVGAVSPTCLQDVSCLAIVKLGGLPGRLGQPCSTHCVQSAQ